MVKYQTQLDNTFAALSDQTRRAILWRLRSGTLTVGELATPFRMSLAAVSKHLKVLEKAKLVRRKRSGRQFLISLNPSPLGAADTWLEQYRNFWDASFDRLNEYIDNKKKGNK